MNRPSTKFKPMRLDEFESLLADQPEDERWELINGHVVRMMVGARWEHGQIISNLHFALRRRFAEIGSPCRVLTESFRVQHAEASSSLLPDVVVFCTRLSPGATFLTNPTMVVEVLSDKTARRDREDKWAAYRQLASLKHYVLVTRDAPRIEVFDRHGDTWSGLRIVDGLDASLDLPALDVSIAVREVYADLLG